MLIDLHADTPMFMQWLGYDFCKRHRPWVPGGAIGSNVDLPRMQQAGMDAQVFSLVATWPEADPLGNIHAMIDRMEGAVEESAGGFSLVRSMAELRAVRARGARAGFLSIEGVHPLKGSLDRADGLIDRGVISWGLAHFNANEACYPAQGIGRQDDQGLTEFGVELVRHLGARGALVDLTHINRPGYFDALTHATGPVLVSHTGVDGAHPHWRNLDDEQIRALADKGGVAGVIFARNFVGGNDIEAVVRHVLHLIDVGGESMPALGSDFDGFILPVRGLRDITGLGALREALRRQGLSARVVDGVMGDNAAAVLERADG